MLIQVRYIELSRTVFTKNYKSTNICVHVFLNNLDVFNINTGTTSKSRRASDIISMLVNIYGSKELFVQEYRTLLADRILTQFNYEIVKEIRYLELLKLRFGESQLHYCEVMLKDVADSKRLNSRVMDERLKAAKREVKGFCELNWTNDQ